VSDGTPLIDVLGSVEAAVSAVDRGIVNVDVIVFKLFIRDLVVLPVKSRHEYGISCTVSAAIMVVRVTPISLKTSLGDDFTSSQGGDCPSKPENILVANTYFVSGWLTSFRPKIVVTPTKHTNKSPRSNLCP
jgi:hypothetical protein